jgi:hypothetical protein
MSDRISYREYEQRRLGAASTEWAKIKVMLRRSLGSDSFAGFWRYWNPLFSYYLSYRCYRPLVRFLPRSLAVILTFAVSGAIHDFFASLVLWEVSVFFTSLFAVFGMVIVFEEGLGLHFRWASFWLRCCINGAILGGIILLGLRLRDYFAPLM